MKRHAAKPPQVATCRDRMITSGAKELSTKYNVCATNHRVNRRQMAYLVTEIKP